MKTLSVKAPWAWLICAGYKDIENRTWKTNYRGRILIHVPANSHKNWSHIYPPQAMDIKLPNRSAMSAIIGEVEIIDCIKNARSIWAQAGCWHWIMGNPILYDTPILGVKGRLGLWDYENKKQGEMFP